MLETWPAPDTPCNPTNFSADNGCRNASFKTRKTWVWWGRLLSDAETVSTILLHSFPANKNWGRSGINTRVGPCLFNEYGVPFIRVSTSLAWSRANSGKTPGSKDSSASSSSSTFSETLSGISSILICFLGRSISDSRMSKGEAGRLSGCSASVADFVPILSVRWAAWHENVVSYWTNNVSNFLIWLEGQPRRQRWKTRIVLNYSFKLVNSVRETEKLSWFMENYSVIKLLWGWPWGRSKYMRWFQTLAWDEVLLRIGYDLKKEWRDWITNQWTVNRTRRQYLFK